MSTLMREDPQPGPEQSLHECIDGPEDTTKGGGGDVFGGQEGVKEVEGGCE